MKSSPAKIRKGRHISRAIPMPIPTILKRVFQSLLAKNISGATKAGNNFVIVPIPAKSAALYHNFLSIIAIMNNKNSGSIVSS